jgi:hypothetical protein
MAAFIGTRSVVGAALLQDTANTMEQCATEAIEAVTLRCYRRVSLAPACAYSLNEPRARPGRARVRGTQRRDAAFDV